jgi:hypothetical protein
VNVTHVFLQMSFLAKRPGAEVAFERFRARMDHRMDSQIAGRREHFTTHLATVTFFAIALRIHAVWTAVVTVFTRAQIGWHHILILIFVIFVVFIATKAGRIPAEIRLVVAADAQSAMRIKETLKALKFSHSRSCCAVLPT